MIVSKLYGWAEETVKRAYRKSALSAWGVTWASSNILKYVKKLDAYLVEVERAGKGVKKWSENL
jgi:hypothetical protein